MAVGDTVTTLQTIADTAELLIQPAPGVEWLIHNVYFSGAVQLYKTDGLLEILFDSDSSAGARLGFVWNVTNGTYLKLRNASGAAADLGYDGVITKEP